jgi:hypothetical protein
VPEYPDESIELKNHVGAQLSTRMAADFVVEGKLYAPASNGRQRQVTLGGIPALKADNFYDDR